MKGRVNYLLNAPSRGEYVLLNINIESVGGKLGASYLRVKNNLYEKLIIYFP